MNKKLEFFSSMAVAFIVLILVFLCIRFSGQGKFATHGGTNPSDVKCIYTSVWPDNEYTRLICEPESGTIEYILDGSNAGYYAIFYNNISEEEIQKYIDQLKTLGYAEEASASESVSTGVLLRKDETWISIAYSEGGFGIRILSGAVCFQRHDSRLCHPRQGRWQPTRPHSADHPGNGRTRQVAPESPKGIRP